MEIIFDYFRSIFEETEKFEKKYESEYIDKKYIDFINHNLTKNFFSSLGNLNKKLFWSTITYRGEKDQIVSDFFANFGDNMYFKRVFKIIPAWLLDRINEKKTTSITSLLLNKDFNPNQISITFNSHELKDIFEHHILKNYRDDIKSLFTKIRNIKYKNTATINKTITKISDCLNNIDLKPLLGRIFELEKFFNNLKFFFFSYFLTAIRQDASFEQSIEIENIDYFCLFPRTHMAESFRGIYIISFRDLNDKEKNFLIKSKFSNFKLLLYYLLSIDFSKKIKIDNKKIIKQSLKSAISAIMSRNMSHNIGSHVLADLVSKMDSNSSEHLNHFYRYLQNRMDFIAQITTDFPEWTYPAYFNKEIMRIFYESYILIDRIGVSEGLGAYKWPKDWRKGDMRGKIIVRTCTTQWKNGEETDAFDWGVNEYHMGGMLNDLQLAIPGGIVGYHAFYIIIENIIRNSAKHDYDARMKESLKLDNNIKDEIIFIKSKNSNKCSFWVIHKNDPCEILKLNDTNTDKTKEKIKNARAIIIESPCVVVKKKENPNNADKDEYEFFWKTGDGLFEIQIIDDRLSLIRIRNMERLFIACIDNKCIENKGACQFNIEDCLVVDKKYWTQNNPHFQLLTEYEYNNQLKEKYPIAEGPEKVPTDPGQLKEEYEGIINFLQKGPLRINIRIDNMLDKDYLWVTIWDNMRHKPSITFDKNNDEHKEVSREITKNDMKKKRVLRIPEDANQEDYEIVNLFGFMNDRLRKSFIKETGELKREDWGIAELKICAGFLQNRQIEEIGGSGKKIIQYGLDCFNISEESDTKSDGKYIITEKDNPNEGYPRMLIKALPVNKTGQLFNEDQGGKLGIEDYYFLGFRFWMKKPKTVLLHGIGCQKEKVKNAG